MRILTFLIALALATPLFAQTYTPINRGRLQTDLDANGFSVTNLSPSGGFIRTTNGIGTNTTFYGTTGTNIITILGSSLAAANGTYYYSNGNLIADCGETLYIWTNSSGNGYVIALDWGGCADGAFEIDDSLSDIQQQLNFNWLFENGDALSIQTNPNAPWSKVRNVAGTVPPVSFFGRPAAAMSGPLIGDANNLTNFPASQITGTLSNSNLPNPLNVGQVNASGLLVVGNTTFSNAPLGSATSLSNQTIHAYALANQLPTPPLICSTFRDCYLANVRVSESFVKSNVDFLFTNGLYLYGWTNISIDDGWQANTRDGNGNLKESTNFPSGFTNLVSYVHSKGMTISLYTSFGPATCAGYPGTDLAHVAQDVRKWAFWGFDGMTSDICGIGNPDIDYTHRYCRAVGNAILELPFFTGKTNRMYLYLSPGNTAGLFHWFIPYECNGWYDGYGFGGCPTFGNIANGVALADCQAGTGWRSLSSSGPGHYADLVSITTIDTNVQAAQISMVMILASGQHGQSFFTLPTFQSSGGPLASWRWLTNSEVNSLNFDPACIPGSHVSSTPANTATFVRPLGGWTTGTNGVLLANYSGSSQNIPVSCGQLFGISSNTPIRIRDLWAKADASGSPFQNAIIITVPDNHVGLFRFDSIPSIADGHLVLSTNSTAPSDTATIKSWITVTLTNGVTAKLPIYY